MSTLTEKATKLKKPESTVNATTSNPARTALSPQVRRPASAGSLASGARAFSPVKEPKSSVKAGKPATTVGLLGQKTAENVLAYTESVSYDAALYRQDIAGSKAHARMLAKQGIIDTKDADALCKGLEQVQREIESDRFIWKREFEDVHMNIENRLTELVGEVGKKLHTGRSRNDQVALDFRLFASDSVRAWRLQSAALIEVLLRRARAHQTTLLPGYTHMQPAQPVSLGQHLSAYADMFLRDVERLGDADRRIRVSPLGAAALAGTTYPSDPAFVAKQLDMHGIFRNSMDAVSDRDFALEAIFDASLIMMHLSRLCEDIILWANPSFGFVRLPDGYATGSSIMPQKKNPDVAELMRGKTGRVYGALVSLLTVMKGLPMTYNRDLQEDKEPFFDVNKTVSLSLTLMTGMLSELTFVPERMAEVLKSGFLNATELADYLVGKGLPFRDAYLLTKKAVTLAQSKGLHLEDLSLKDLRKITPAVQEDVFAVLDYGTAVARRRTPGGTGSESVKAQMKDIRARLKKVLNR